MVLWDEGIAGRDTVPMRVADQDLVQAYYLFTLDKVVVAIIKQVSGSGDSGRAAILTPVPPAGPDD